MSNNPNNPLDPPPSTPVPNPAPVPATPSTPGPWIYSGVPQSTPAYYAPPPPPAPASPSPAPSSTPFSPPVPQPLATPRTSPHPPQPAPKSADASLAGIIDTIEAIIIALIIALTFRAFIVEAFVIPTGSMAPTLLGAHFKAICPKCGYAFDRDASLHIQFDARTKTLVNVGDRAELRSNQTIPVGEVTCPNCFLAIAPTMLPDFLDSKFIPSLGHNANFAWANNGDRILVLKYIYSLIEPSRWDVIVFKEPEKARDNYIKRLIALPGETVEIINGDIFIAPPGRLSQADRAIARKPDHVQPHVWQLVYDNNFYPTDEAASRAPNPPWTNPWSPGPAWTKGPILTYSGTGPSTLQFDPRGSYATNILGYNNDMNEASGRAPVGDLRVETVWSPHSADAASISILLGRADNCYRAIWKSNAVSLEQYDATSRTFKPVSSVTAASPPTPQPGKSYHIAMNNVDHAIHFFIDGQRILSRETPWSAQDAYAQEDAQRTIAREAQQDTLIRIDVAGPCSLAHLRLLRDLYYTQSDLQRQVFTANSRNPLTLGQDEFFALGDNSRKSLDGRMWSRVFPALDDLAIRQGVVPRRYLLGKAFFVYWPAGFRPTKSIPYLNNIPLVPNTGDMRFIR